MTHKKGFTLVEIIVVIIIVGILAAIAIPNYIICMEQQEARNAENNLMVIVNAQKTYYLNTGNYCNNTPGTASLACQSIPGGDGRCANTLADINCNLSLNISDPNFSYTCFTQYGGFDCGTYNYNNTNNNINYVDLAYYHDSINPPNKLKCFPNGSFNFCPADMIPCNGGQYYATSCP